MCPLCPHAGEDECYECYECYEASTDQCRNWVSGPELMACADLLHFTILSGVSTAKTLGICSATSHGTGLGNKYLATDEATKRQVYIN